MSALKKNAAMQKNRLNCRIATIIVLEHKDSGSFRKTKELRQ
jgi:hypothetical protein